MAQRAIDLEIPTPEWAEPLLAPCSYKGAKGGRGSGKSHFFAELVIESLILNPYLDIVCIREVQKSLTYSAKKLLEGKIEALGVGSLFSILKTEIRRVDKHGAPLGIIIFQGMQDHTAESIKSLEDFNIAWVEEAQNLSQRSLNLLRPTIRADDSEIWFSWNPDQDTDPIEKFLVADGTPDDAIVVHVNFDENPFLPQKMKAMAVNWQRDDPDSYAHVWLGAYNTKADDQVLGGKWIVDEFEVQPTWDGPYYGADWGFSTDPNAIVEVWVDTVENKIYIRRELWEVGIEIEDTPGFFARMPGIAGYVIRADSARPEMISYVKRHGYRKIIAAEKWDGSVKDGISKLRSYRKIVIHPECPKTAMEARMYKYKRDRLTDDILPDLIDKHNHTWDSIRYAIEPLTKRKPASVWD